MPTRIAQMEDKKCRICGLADMENINIFHSKTLPSKIVAVYPIALYRNDPLPKHICKKCHLSTTNMYIEMERALRNHNKWIANIRSAQPENQYLKVVDSISGANKQTSQLVSLIAGKEIGERTISKLFNFDTDTNPSANKSRSTPTDNSALLNDEKTDEKEDPTAEASQQNQSPQSQKPQITKSKPPEAKITQLKSVLELNGCTLTKLKPTNKATNPSPAAQSKTTEIEGMQIDIKEEPLDQGYELPIHVEHETHIAVEHEVKCKMCLFSCETIEELAIHQLEHLNIAAWKISERRILSKRVRRGRLIMVEEKKCIRCLNCWRIFADNKSILKHWSEGDCDFFCQICGKEFAASPKMLREHIPAAHGISYRSSKILRRPALSPKKTIKAEKSPTKSTLNPVAIKIEPSSSQNIIVSPNKNKSVKHVPNGSLTQKVACGICLKVFANFKARNSHMRAHKHPPFLPDLPPPPLDQTLMALNRPDMVKIKEEPLEIGHNLFQGTSTPVQATSVAPSTSRAGPAFSKATATIKHPRLKNLPLRTNSGTRKKFTPKKPQPSHMPIKPDPDLLDTESLQMKLAVDLQDPCVSSQLPEDSEKMSFESTPTSTPSPKLPSSSSNGSTSINGLSFDFGVPPKDNMNYNQVFTCHPCKTKFNSKLELFRHKRKCTANKLFPCQFCEKHFFTSADLQIHIMLLHKSINAQ